MDFTGLSLAGVAELRAAALTRIRHHAASIDRLAVALADVDAALQQNVAEKNIDLQNALVLAARRLAALLDGGPA